MSDGTDKVAGQVPGVMNAAAQHLRKMAGKNVELSKRAEAAEHEVRVMKIARRMEQRGLEPGLAFEEKIAALRDLEPVKLSHMEQAIELAAGGFHLGHVEEKREEKRASHGGELYATGDGGSDLLEDFVVTQRAFGES